MAQLSDFASEVPADKAATTHKPEIVRRSSRTSPLYEAADLGHLFRYRAYVEEDGSVILYEYHFTIERKTPACDVIFNEETQRYHYVQRGARKRFAYEDKRMALHSLQRRTHFRVGYAQQALDQANAIDNMFATYPLEVLLDGPE